MTENEAKDKFQLIILKMQKTSSNDTVQKFVFLLDPKEKLLCKGLIAWKNINVQLDFLNPKDLLNQQQFIWQFSRFDLKSFCTMLQIQKVQAINLVNRLKHLNLIFPDGTVNTQAYALLLKYTQIELQKKIGINKNKQTNKKSEQ